MENIKIERSDSTPSILIDFDEKYLEIKGVSIPEDTEDFYNPLLKALEEYIEAGETGEVHIVFKFIYINTGTSAVIVKILKLLEGFDTEEADIKIEWFYEENDEDMKDLGDYFHSFTELPFETVSCEEITFDEKEEEEDEGENDDE